MIFHWLQKNIQSAYDHQTFGRNDDIFPHFFEIIASVFSPDSSCPDGWAVGHPCRPLLRIAIKSSQFCIDEGVSLRLSGCAHNHSFPAKILYLLPVNAVGVIVGASFRRTGLAVLFRRARLQFYVGGGIGESSKKVDD